MKKSVEKKNALKSRIVVRMAELVIECGGLRPGQALLQQKQQIYNSQILI